MVVRLATRAELPARDTLAQNILATYAWANDAHKREGSVWYQSAHTFARGLSERYGITLEQAAGVIAALSPQLSWSRNMTCADEIIRTGDTRGVLGLSKRNARAILAGAHPLDVLNGPKTRAFFDNILRPTASHAVTVDVHATDVALGSRGASRGLHLDRGGRYDAIADAYRSAADSLGILPLVLQAVCWVAWRESYAWRRAVA